MQYTIYFKQELLVKFYFTLILLLFLLMVAFIFGSQNDQMITLNYLIAQSNISVAMAVSLFTTLGFLLGVLAMLMWRFTRVIKKKLIPNNPSLLNDKVTQ